MKLTKKITDLRMGDLFLHPDNSRKCRVVGLAWFNVQWTYDGETTEHTFPYEYSRKQVEIRPKS